VHIITILAAFLNLWYILHFLFRPTYLPAYLPALRPYSLLPYLRTQSFRDSFVACSHVYRFIELVTLIFAYSHPFTLSSSLMYLRMHILA